MKIRVWSDLHIDGAAFRHPKEKSDDILVVAGDVANNLDTSKQFLFMMGDYFREVIFVPGNHEYYRGHFVDSDKSHMNKDNVHVLDGDFIIIDDVAFIGATLWTNFNGGDPLMMYSATRGVNDFRLIDVSEGVRITPEWMIRRSQYDLNFIKEECKRMSDKKKVVVTHFPPSRKFQHPKWGTLNENLLNAYFMSDFEHEIQDLEFSAWICGHTHDGLQFEKWGKKFVCNPRGYAYRGVNENCEFDYNLTIEV